MRTILLIFFVISFCGAWAQYHYFGLTGRGEGRPFLWLYGEEPDERFKAKMQEARDRDPPGPP